MTHPGTTMRAIGLTVLLTATGCAPRIELPPAPAVPTQIGVSYITPAYRIQVGDELSIRVLLNTDLNEDVTVRPDGHISTTIVHDERAANRTVPELIDILNAGYARYLQKPHVSVIVKTIAPIRVFVGGEVAIPGEQVVAGAPPTLAQAIARAGGLKLSGDETRVFLVRRGENDSPVYLSTRYDSIMSGSDPLADIRLAPFDVVMVPKLGIAELYRWYYEYVQQFANPSFSFSYLLNPTVAGQTFINSGR
jgi:polysaccharide export outer membrane protein